MQTASAAETKPGKKTFNAETFMLKNGMQVVVIPNHRAPVVSHMVWYKVGAADDPTGKTGIAHFFEHLMFKGTKSVAAGEISRIIARNGGQDNAFTSYDFTAYFQNIAVDRLPLVMELESDRMQNLTLDPAIVKTERTVVEEERRQTTDSNPERRLQEQLNATLYVQSPYGRPIIGWTKDIEALDKKDADAFYARWYAPNNAILVVSGDVTAATLKPLAEKYYGHIARRDVPERVRADVPPMPASRRVVLHDDNVQQPAITLAYLAPGFNEADEADPYAIHVMSQILAGGQSSILYRDMVSREKTAADIDTSYNPYSLGRTSFTIQAVPTPKVTPEKLEKELRHKLKTISNTPFTDDEVERAKSQLVAAATYARDSVMHPAYLFGMALTTGQTVEDVESWTDRIAAVTTADVKKAMDVVLVGKEPVTALLLPPLPLPTSKNLH